MTIQELLNKYPYTLVDSNGNTVYRTDAMKDLLEKLPFFQKELNKHITIGGKNERRRNYRKSN
jgi:hypothetical protein